ncbi:MAG: hypothetical protein KF686_13600 [Ramlibacter sp.]|nr:hypothetical protein [Ramlibacter sp.]
MRLGIDPDGLAIFLLVISIAGYVITLWIAYLVIKMAIRDGIRESGLVSAIKSETPDWTNGRESPFSN